MQPRGRSMQITHSLSNAEWWRSGKEKQFLGFTNYSIICQLSKEIHKRAVFNKCKILIQLLKNQISFLKNWGFIVVEVTNLWRHLVEERNFRNERDEAQEKFLGLKDLDFQKSLRSVFYAAEISGSRQGSADRVRIEKIQFFRNAPKI